MNLALYGIFALGLLFSPYWLVPTTWPLRILVLAGITLTGFYWSSLATGNPQLKLSPAQFRTSWGIAVLLFIINIPALLHPLPLYGDEDYHIGRTLMLGAYLFATLKTPLFWGLALSGCTLALVFIRKYFVPACLTVLGLSLGLAGLPFLETANGLTTKIIPSILDYPFLTKWLTLPWIMVIPGAGLTTELLFRMVPLFSCILLATVVYNFTKNIFYGISIALLPIIWYYSSILYLDITAVVLMTITLLYSQDLLALPFKKLKDQPYWYALILIGFSKETVLPFILLIIAARTVWQWLHKKKYSILYPGDPTFCFLCRSTALYLFKSALSFSYSRCAPLWHTFHQSPSPRLGPENTHRCGLRSISSTIILYPWDLFSAQTKKIRCTAALHSDFFRLYLFFHDRLATLGALQPLRALLLQRTVSTYDLRYAQCP